MAAPMILRGLLLPFGMLGVLWSYSVLPSFVMAAPARDISARVMADERFKAGVLMKIFERMETFPRAEMTQPEFIQAEALLALRTAEEAVLSKSSKEADRAAAVAENKVRASLVNSPTESFLWLMLYSVATTRNGFDSQYLSWLDRSYAAGPHEAWIALRRNRLALNILPVLSEATQRVVLSEFAEIVDADYIDEATASLMSVGWAHRTRLLSQLIEVDVGSRQALARRLASEGLKVSVPGVGQTVRPWW
ncbi:hypothetical protein IVB02_35740 [Bradyrhizobium sp. 166]|uniref:hypothetical protein n=1 Tax=Bradyrhizobium sp. 166 TaxID=2782638 RepID=UPI001FF77417|nr:hypothetical protein [Bradyrhizobium sp. 166]MCK1606586.1 hypothetical protein [Bradyrhizobium sp. 166]